eukprot:355949-Chlamydomonas_euryale.AAC.2
MPTPTRLAQFLPATFVQAAGRQFASQLRLLSSPHVVCCFHAPMRGQNTAPSSHHITTPAMKFPVIPHAAVHEENGKITGHHSRPPFLGHSLTHCGAWQVPQAWMRNPACRSPPFLSRHR